MLKDIYRILFVALLALSLGVSIVPLSYGHLVKLGFLSSPINGIRAWFETQLGGTTEGPFSTDFIYSTYSSDQRLPPGEGAYKIAFELQPEIGGTEYILSHFIVNYTEKVGYKQDVVDGVDVGYLRESLFGDTMIEAFYEPIQYGPKIDKLRFKVKKGPDAQLIAMQTCEVDVLTDLIRSGDIEKLDREGFTITSTPGFHMGHIGINIRPDQSYKDAAHGSPIAGPVLSDVNFRHALFHCYNQEQIVASVYKYIVTPVQSLVPPAQGEWQNPAVPKHPYNPGDPIETTVYNPGTGEYEDACSILRYGGYVWCNIHESWAVPYDLDEDGTLGATDGTITDHDDELKAFATPPYPGLRVFTPTYEVAPTSADHGARFVADCNSIGIPLFHDPRDLEEYLNWTFGTEGDPGGEFDLYMVFWSLGTFPDHLYDMCHSSFDTRIVPGAYNAPGIHSDQLDEAVSTIKFNIDHDEAMEAAYLAQVMLYNEAYPECAFSYMQLYSRIYFDAFMPGLKSVVNSPGYGSDNMWTFRNMHWEPGHPNERIEGGNSTVNWCLGENPERLNPTFAHTVYAWEIIDPTLDGLIAVNPYTHEYVPWLAWKWGTERWATEEDVDRFNTGSPFVVKGSDWHEAWPNFCTSRTLTDWGDYDPFGKLSIGDSVKFDEPYIYNVTSVTWGIKAEYKWLPIPDDEDGYPPECYKEVRLSGTDITLPKPPLKIYAGQMTGTNWHEEWPERSTTWPIYDFRDNGDGLLSRGDEIYLMWPEWNQTWWHVESVTVTLHLDKIDPHHGDGVVDRVVEYAGTGMKLLFWLRDDIHWQCGNNFTAQDVRFNWLFLRNNTIPRYASMWEHLDDVVTVGRPYGKPHFKVIAYLDVTSPFLLYDFARTAAMLPPPVWERFNGRPLKDILAYDPSENTSKPAGAGPWFGEKNLLGQPLGAVTQLYGTGPFIFQLYINEWTGTAIEWANHRYWKPTKKMQAETSEMFHAIGDADWDGEIGIFDLSRMGMSFGYFCYENIYDAQADVNQDCVVDMRDITLSAFYWGDKREYPDPQNP